MYILSLNIFLKKFTLYVRSYFSFFTNNLSSESAANSTASSKFYIVFLQQNRLLNINFNFRNLILFITCFLDLNKHRKTTLS
jgi:hypothetical protein